MNNDILVLDTIVSTLLSADYMLSCSVNLFADALPHL